MKNKKNKKGFTLAELLIVVAIIAVLVAIAIPIFSAQLDKSKAATDQANARSLYATLVADYLDNNTIDQTPSATSLSGKGTITVGSNKFDFSDKTTSLSITTSGQPVVALTTNGQSFTFGS